MSSMLDILKNFNDASQGNKPAGPAQVGSMKAILEGFNRASTSANLDECGTPMEGGCMSPEPSMEKPGNPVTMNVSLTASGKENVDELISLMKMAGVSSHDHSMSTPSTEPDMATMRALVVGNDDEVEEWSNSPEGVEGDAEYQDDNYMTKDLAGGLNREKKAYKKAQDGDNAMALENSIKKQLWAALNEKKYKKKKM